MKSEPSLTGIPVCSPNQINFKLFSLNSYKIQAINCLPATSRLYRDLKSTTDFSKN